MNLYGYAAGDPVNYSDPFGLCPTPDGGDDGKPCPGNEGSTLDERQKLIDFHNNVVLPLAVGPLLFGMLEQSAGAAVGAADEAEASASRTIVHYTSEEGAAAIEESGYLRAGSFVAIPGETAGMSARQVEKFLEIGAGKGAMRGEFSVKADMLKIPFNGPKTSGQGTQYQLTKILPVRPGDFTPTP